MDTDLKNKVWEILEDGPKTWKAMVEENHDNPEECILTFPEDLLDRVGWVEGDKISWDLQANESVILRKI
jgi:hypothetical protein